MGRSMSGSGGSGTGGTVSGLGWGEDDLRRAYRELASLSSSFRRLSAQVDEGVWVRFNQLADAELSEVDIAAQLPITMEMVVALKSPRRCLERYDHDYEKVRRCLEGHE